MGAIIRAGGGRLFIGSSGARVAVSIQIGGWLSTIIHIWLGGRLPVIFEGI
jgi:hypothetical protein